MTRDQCIVTYDGLYFIEVITSDKLDFLLLELKIGTPVAPVNREEDSHQFYFFTFFRVKSPNRTDGRTDKTRNASY